MFINISTKDFFLSEFSLRVFVKRSLPTTLTDDLLESLNIARVSTPQVPEYDVFTQKLVRKTAPELVDGHYELGWEIVQLTAEEQLEQVEHYRNVLITKASDTRTRNINGGSVQLSNNIFISTSYENRQAIHECLTASNIRPDRVIKWKHQNGWFDADSGMIQEMFIAVDSFHEQEYLTEFNSVEAIKNCDVDSLRYLLA
jgi:hypothetical protein